MECSEGERFGNNLRTSVCSVDSFPFRFTPFITRWILCPLSEEGRRRGGGGAGVGGGGAAVFWMYLLVVYTLNLFFTNKPPNLDACHCRVWPPWLIEFTCFVSRFLARQFSRMYRSTKPLQKTRPVRCTRQYSGFTDSLSWSVRT